MEHETIETLKYGVDAFLFWQALATCAT
jgi:hypothetical protein